MGRDDRHGVWEAKTTGTSLPQCQTRKGQPEPFGCLGREAGAGDARGRGECGRLPHPDPVGRRMGDDSLPWPEAGNLLPRGSLPCLMPSALRAHLEQFGAENSEEQRSSFTKMTRDESTRQEYIISLDSDHFF